MVHVVYGDILIKVYFVSGPSIEYFGYLASLLEILCGLLFLLLVLIVIYFLDVLCLFEELCTF